MLAYNRHECARIDDSGFDRYCGFNFDTSQDITADYLRNTYGEVESKEHADFIIELAGNAGTNVRKGCWYDESLSFFCIHNGEWMFLANKEVACDSGERKIKLPMPPKEEKQMFGNTAKELDESFKKQADEWPKVGEEYLCFNYEVSEYLKVKVLDAKTESDEFAVASITDDGSYCSLWWGCSFKEIQTPLDALSDLLLPIVVSNSRETSGYVAEQIAKAILSGEIDGLEYKKPQ